MEDQAISSLSFVQFGDDRYLGQLFEVAQDQESCNFHKMHIDGELKQEVIYDISFVPEQIERGYESQEGTKKNKSKKIKKKKPIFIQKEQQAKKRRVKIYIQSLENRIAELQAENQKLKKINQLNIDYIKKLNDSEQIINGFFVDRQKIFERLQKLVQSTSPDPVKIEMQCNALLKRQGVFGKERIRAINYYFKLLLHLILPDTQKYISEAASNSTDIFNPNLNLSQESQQFQCMKKVSLNDQIIQRLLEKQEDLKRFKAEFNDKILSMYNHKCELLVIARQMQKILEDMGSKITNLEKAKFLCYSYKARVKESCHPHNLKEMYDQLEKCSRFSYSNPNSNQKSFLY